MCLLLKTVGCVAHVSNQVVKPMFSDIACTSAGEFLCLQKKQAKIIHVFCLRDVFMEGMFIFLGFVDACFSSYQCCDYAPIIVILLWLMV